MRTLGLFFMALGCVAVVAWAFRGRGSPSEPSASGRGAGHNARGQGKARGKDAEKHRGKHSEKLVLTPDPGLPRPDPQDLETLGRASGIPEDQRVFVFEQGKARVTTIRQARAAGYQVVDLSDDYAPFLFSEKTPGLDDEAPNEYRKVYINVANDRTDEQGHVLGPDQHNYVELFGIHPSLSVIRRRFLEDEAKECYKALNLKLLAGFHGVIRYKGHKHAGETLARYRAVRRKVRAAMRRLGLKSLRQLARRAAYRHLVAEYQRLQVRVEVVAQTQYRLACEGLLDRSEHYHKGVFDYVTHRAVARFERKHMIFGWGQLYGKTLAYLGSPPLLNNYRALLRTLRERVADSAGIVEDGTVLEVKGLDPTYDVDGKKKKVRNLIQEYTQTLVRTMGLDTPQAALAFFSKQRPELFRSFKVAVRMPPLPEYYSKYMKFRVVIDRGDVWYDYPYDASGRPKPQPRSRLPRLTLYVLWRGQQIPLVSWKTTIGGWRKEHKDGKVYLKYKNSDVGPRVWRDIVAAPVWIPPDSTPPSALVERRKEGGRWVWRLKREEIGPSYLSAYGLVAAYHLQEIGQGRNAKWRDNGIRTHGSVNYMSIFGRYSHGCHRLHNHLAVRLFSFILRHSRFRRRGQVPLRYGRTFQYKGKTFQILLNTRGYYYTLRQPVPVLVTEGRIRGRQKTPIEVYMPVPGEHYDPDDPNLRATGSKGEGWSGADSMPPDVPPADEQPIHPTQAPAARVPSSGVPSGDSSPGLVSRHGPRASQAHSRPSLEPGGRPLPRAPSPAPGSRARAARPRPARRAGDSRSHLRSHRGSSAEGTQGASASQRNSRPAHTSARGKGHGVLRRGSRSHDARPVGRDRPVQ